MSLRRKVCCEFTVTQCFHPPLFAPHPHFKGDDMQNRKGRLSGAMKHACRGTCQELNVVSTPLAVPFVPTSHLTEKHSFSRLKCGSGEVLVPPKQTRRSLHLHHTPISLSF